MPFIKILEAYFKYLVSTKLYLWKKRPLKKPRVSTVPESKKEEEKYIPRLRESKLKELSWSLDILDMKSK